MNTILTTRRLRSFGHVCRLPDTRLPKVAPFSETASGSCPPGWPILRFQDRVRDVLRHCGILVNGVERECAERNGWRKLVHNGATKAESTCREEGQPVSFNTCCFAILPFLFGGLSLQFHGQIFLTVPNLVSERGNGILRFFNECLTNRFFFSSALLFSVLQSHFTKCKHYFKTNRCVLAPNQVRNLNILIKFHLKAMSYGFCFLLTIIFLEN